MAGLGAQFKLWQSDFHFIAPFKERASLNQLVTKPITAPLFTCLDTRTRALGAEQARTAVAAPAQRLTRSICAGKCRDPY